MNTQQTQPRLIDEVMIAEHWLTALEYYDITGLSDDEISDVDRFLADHAGCWFDCGTDTEFTRDTISDLAADCVLVRIYSL